jgi:hypothetical protein
MVGLHQVILVKFLPGVNAKVLFLPKAGVGRDPQEITAILNKDYQMSKVSTKLSFYRSESMVLSYLLLQV